MPFVSCISVDKVIWQEHAGTIKPGGNIHVWRISVVGDRDMISKHETVLSVDEAVRSKQYRSESDQRRFIMSRIWLRTILSQYLVIPAGEIIFSADDNNKPFIQNNTAGVQFNIAHSGDYALVAVADTPIGIDLEKINPAFDHGNVLRISFTDAETAFMESTSYSPEAFYRMWTRKEALAKATGKGIDNDFISMPSMDGLHEVTLGVMGSGKDWNVTSFEIGDYAASVAYSPVAGQVLFLDAKYLNIN